MTLKELEPIICEFLDQHVQEHMKDLYEIKGVHFLRAPNEDAIDVFVRKRIQMKEIMEWYEIRRTP